MTKRNVPGEVTLALDALRQGVEGAEAEVYDLVYPELKRIAERRLTSFPGGATLDSEGVVAECYLKLEGALAGGAFASRKHFYGLASKIMMNLLIDRRRHKDLLGKRVTFSGTLHGVFGAEEGPGNEPLEERVESVLRSVESADPEAAQMTRLALLEGLSAPGIAEVMGASTRTTQRKIQVTLAHLKGELSRG